MAYNYNYTNQHQYKARETKQKYNEDSLGRLMKIQSNETTNNYN